MKHKERLDVLLVDKGFFDSRAKAEKAFYHFKSGSYGRQTFLTGLFQPQNTAPIEVEEEAD